MDSVFYWTGAAVFGLIALGALWLVAEGFVGMAASLSWHRWALKSPTSEFSWRKHAWPMLRSFIEKSWELYGHRNNGNQTYSGSGGYWHGIGDWSAVPKRKR